MSYPDPDKKCLHCKSEPRSLTAPFCRGCYQKLPHELRMGLFNRSPAMARAGLRKALAWLRRPQSQPQQGELF